MAPIDQDSKPAKRSNRGFASMDPQRQREIASEGGRAAHEKGTAHEFTTEEARAAGRKGGQARSESRSAGSRQIHNTLGSANDSAMASGEPELSNEAPNHSPQ